jgi:hypothetical protein
MKKVISVNLFHLSPPGDVALKTEGAGEEPRTKCTQEVSGVA